MSILNNLRQWMMQEGLDYFLVSSTDEYLNEYVGLSENARYHVSAFSGSAGDVLVGKDDALLFVDGRYHKQADEEVDAEIISVVKLQLGESQRGSIVHLLKDKGDLRVGLVSSKISYYTFSLLSKELPDVEFVEYDNDIVLDFAKIEQVQKKDSVQRVDIGICGISADDKLEKIQKELKEDVFVVTKLDEIAYVTNFRSYDISYSSFYKAKMIIDKQKCIVFSDEKLENIGKYFEQRPESEFYTYIESMKDQKVLISTVASNLKTYKALKKNHLEEVKLSPIAKMKSIKNSAEIEHIKKCFEKTDLVVSKTQSWALNLKNLTEKDLSNVVFKNFQEQKANGLSFSTIAAVGSNTAIVHYSSPSENMAQDNMVLVDCGAYFEGGYATDITQTFSISENPTQLQKEVYTTVLKGFLAGINYQMNSKTTGQNLDKVVREVVDASAPSGFSFSHSTGHGVGIAVHESPPFITSSIWGKDILEKGMCFSIEPGLYGKSACGQEFGVRIERVVFVNENHQIEPLSKAPFDEKLINHGMLSKQEVQWLNEWQYKSIN